MQTAEIIILEKKKSCGLLLADRPASFLLLLAFVRPPVEWLANSDNYQHSTSSIDSSRKTVRQRWRRQQLKVRVPLLNGSLSLVEWRCEAERHIFDNNVFREAPNPAETFRRHLPLSRPSRPSNARAHSFI